MVPDALVSQSFNSHNIDAAIPEHYGFSARIYKISNIRHTQDQNLNDSRLIMQLALPNPLKPGVKSRMKM